MYTYLQVHCAYVQIQGKRWLYLEIFNKNSINVFQSEKQSLY